jgi:hypothetical protein
LQLAEEVALEMERIETALGAEHDLEHTDEQEV